MAFAGGRVHGVAPTAVAVWTPEGLITLAPPFARTVARAGGGEWHVRATLAPLARGDRGRGVADPLLLPVPIPGRERRLEVRSRHHLHGRIAVHVRRGRRTWFRGESIARRPGGRGYAARMTSSAMSSSAPCSRPSSRRTCVQTASGGRSTPSSELAQRLEPAVDRVGAGFDEAVGVEHERRVRRELDDVARVVGHPEAERRAGLGPDQPRPAATISGGGWPASENVSCRRSRVVDGGEHGRHRQVEQRGRADAQVREHAIGRVAVVGVGGEHRAQLAHPRGGLRAVAHHVADHQQQAAVLERVGEVEVAADVAPAGARQVARGELDARQLRQPGREQRALQRQREPPLGVEEHRVVERDARPRGELDQHAPVERAADRVEHADRPDHPPAGDEREREHQPVADRLLQARRELARGAARARRPRRASWRAPRMPSTASVPGPATCATRKPSPPPGSRPSSSSRIRSASATITPRPEPVQDDVGEDRQQLRDLERAREPRARRAEDLQAAGGGAAGGERVVALAGQPRGVLLGADAVGDVVEVDAQALAARRGADVEPGVERRVVVLDDRALRSSAG